MEKPRYRTAAEQQAIAEKSKGPLGWERHVGLEPETKAVLFHDRIARLEPSAQGILVTLEDGSVFLHGTGEDEPRLIGAPNGIN